jgi:hypothetical protein
LGTSTRSSFTVFAHELARRSARFEAENGLYLFALTVPFGWIKTIAGQERTKFRGRERVEWAFTFAAAAYNLARLPKLLEAWA